MTDTPQNGYLCAVNGSQIGQRYLLNQTAISLGRDPLNSISIRDNQVSRVHAKIFHQDGEYKIANMDSSNAVFVNGLRVEESSLKHGDEIRIGQTTFHFKLESISGKPSEFHDLAESPAPDVFTERNSSDNPLDVICSISNALSQTADFDELLANILELIFDWTDADRGCILLADDSSEEHRIATLIQREGLRENKINVSKSLLLKVTETGAPVMISSLPTDERCSLRESLQESGIGEAICTPIKYRNRMLGFIYLDVFERTAKAGPLLNEEHARLVAAVGAQTAVAVENHLHYSQLRESNRMTSVGEAMSSLSHHIKNILQGISGGAHILEDGMANNNLDLTTQGWGIVRRNQGKITQLVLDMLSFASEHELDIKTIDLNRVISSVIEKIIPDVNQELLTIDWLPNKDIDNVSADRKRIFRAIENLVRNAVDACRNLDDGRVTIRLKFDSKENDFQIVVSDNGCGISEENLPKIFSLFESSKGDRSTGIGLTVAQKFAREHNGEIFAKSWIDEGSEFTLILPHANKRAPSMSKLNQMCELETGIADESR